MTSQHRRLRLVALCECGAWGPPEQLAWMGPCCGPCWDRQENERVQRVAAIPTDGQATGLTFSPDGRSLAGRDRSGVSVWDVATGARLHHWTRQGLVDKVAFSPEGEWLAWCIPQADRLEVRALGSDLEAMEDGQTFAFGRDRSHLLVHDAAGRLVDHEPAVGWDWLEPEKRVLGLTPRPLRVPFPVRLHDLAVSPDGRMLAAAGDGAGLLFWDVDSGQPLSRAQVGVCVGPVVWSPDGTAVAVGVAAGHWKAILWDVPVGQRRGVIGDNAMLFDLAFTPDGGWLVSCEDGRMRAWEVHAGLERRCVSLFADRVRSLALSPDGRLAALGMESGEIRLWPGEVLRPE
jgi:WD40 repeat protein